jgi:hypothetical protein
MFKISYEKFSSEFAHDLGITEGRQLILPLKELPQYDSMGKITASLTIERLFGFQIDYEVLDSSETLQSLYEYCRNK